jgi:hypothetical protein
MRRIVTLALAVAAIAGPMLAPAEAFTGFVRPTPPNTYATPPDPWSHWPPRHFGDHRFEHRRFAAPDVVVIVPGAPVIEPDVVWVPGQWAWNGVAWVWVPGHWAR